jgi:hypothetical protein
MSNPESMSRDDPEWPEFAPAWAERAFFEPAAGMVTFARAWTMPGAFREMESLNIVTVQQVFARGDNNAFVPEPVRVVAGADALWTDHRAEHVAATLREIADALVPGVKAEVTA